MIVSNTGQKTMPILKKNHETSSGAKRTPTSGTMMFPTTGMNQAGLACLIS